jgi:hypothetical protein
LWEGIDVFGRFYEALGQSAKGKGKGKKEKKKK